MVKSLYGKLLCMLLSTLMFVSIFVTMPAFADVVNAASAPTKLKINEYSASAAKISWSKVSGATGYIVYRSTNGSSFSKIKTLNSGSTSYTNTGLVSGSSYWYAVASYQTSNGSTITSSKSSSVKLTTTTSKSVPIPKNLKIAEYSNTAVKLTWTAVSSVTGYYVYRSTDGKSYTKIKEITSASTTTYTNSSLTSGKKYYYLIASYKKLSNGTIAIGPKSSSPVSTTTTTASSVPAPANFKIAEYSSNAIKLSWSKVSGVTGYYIYRSTDGKSYTKIKNITSASATTYTNGSLGTGKRYYYKIASYKKSSNSTIAIGPKSSKIAKVTTTSTVVTVKTTRTSNSIKLTWNKVSNAEGYQILKLNSSTNTYSKIYTASASRTSYTDSKLSSNKKYSYKIRAYYKVGTVSAYSPYTSVSAKTNYPAVTGLSVASSSYSSITLKWTAASGASGYQIYILNSSNGKYELAGTVTANVTSYTVGFLSPATTYSFKVRACYINGSAKSYGDYAEIQVITPMANKEMSMADEIFELINNERKKAGIRLLQKNDEITEVAQLRAVEISQKFGATRPNGKSWDTVLDDAGIYDWRYIGELRSHGFLNASSVVSDWMSDKTSKNQVLDEKVTDLGVGVYYKGNTPYYVAFFYRPIN